jgi:hypothetical protein
MQDSSATQTASSRSTTNAGGWIVSNAETSRSGSPSNEGTSTGDRSGTTGAGVSGSTSTARGTSGTGTATGSVDTEAHGAGVRATDQAGSTVGAGATVGTKNSQAATSGSASAAGATSYKLAGLTNPNEYAHKRVEITGILDNTRANARSRRKSDTTASNTTVPMLRVNSVRILGESCQ